ncbi:hypothetical protein Lser_V15G31779 [Lactuca serriola]
MANFNMNTMTSYSHLLGSSTKILMLIPKYYDQWVHHMEDYLNGIDEDLWKCIIGKVHSLTMLQNVGTVAASKDVAQQAEKPKKNEKRCMRELRGALPPVVYNYLHSCKTSKEIWDILKEKYQGSEKTKISYVKQYLLELGEFKQKEGESIKMYYDHLNEITYKCNKYGVIRSIMEFNLTFIMGLRKEWRNVSLMIKNQQSFDYFFLSDLYNVLKAHENEVNEIIEETRNSLGGPLALMSNVASKEVEKETFENEGSDDEGLIVNSEDEAVDFYSNNRVKKFFKNPFNSKSRASEMKGNSSRKNVNDEKRIEKMEVKTEEAKIEKKKLKGDSGFNFDYCNGVNHMASECMLKKRDEKKSRVKDESYYVERLEEVRAKTKGMSLVVKGIDDEEATYQSGL